mgnify:CR=1 FL=1
MKKYSLLILLSVCVLLTHAQNRITTSDLPYLCDFEDDTENANWVLNPGIEKITTPNKWVIGAATSYTGEKSMYVSRDGGITTAYADTNNVLIAYRDISLDRGQYDVAFDWKGMGNKDDGYLKVVFESRATSDIACIGNNVEPSWVSYAVSCMGTNTRLNGEDLWMHVQATFSVPPSLANRQDTRVLFVWVNSKVKVKNPTSVAIDNFQLAKASPTGYPADIHVSTFMRTATVSWTGSADGYEVLYRKKNEETFKSITTDTTAVDLIVPERDYGAYEFWICCINGTDKSVYTIFPTVYIYKTDCFDALNMYNATFEWGTWKGTNKTVGGYDKIDYGSESPFSRHTTHFDTTEIDPRTITVVEKMVNGKKVKDTISLHTVPQGEYGSVRIGNWNTGSEYESITFRYTVEDTKQALLLVHYAIVLENPGHDAADQPRFTLEIKDANGKDIDPKCGNVDFHSPSPDELFSDPEIKSLWHITKGGAVNWQDWRTVGLNLEKYVGQELQLKFTSYDCDQDGHYGYAYFTLRCSRSDVDGIPWGNDSQSQEFTAPEGLTYAWFNVLDTQFKDTVSTERIFQIHSADTNKYVCHATYPTNPDCGFEFTACAKPHNPIAEIQWWWTPQNCTNSIFVRNGCHVGLKNQVTGEIEHDYSTHMDECRWTMPDGTVIDTIDYYDGFVVPIKDEGDTLTYSLWGGIYVNDSLFQDSTTVTIIVPRIGHDTVTAIDTTVCYGTYVEFPVGTGRLRDVEGDYYEEAVSKITGCDSTSHMRLNVIMPLDTLLVDTICAEGRYWFVDEWVSETGNYVKHLPCISTGCDSIVTLDLVRAERPIPTIQNKHICGGVAGGDNLIIELSHSEWVDSFKVIVPHNEPEEFRYLCDSANFKAIIEPTQVRANVYPVQLVSYMTWCDAYVVTDTFYIDLSSKIVQVLSDEMYAILNADHNGGYDIRSYQWYKNGAAIEGATKSTYFEMDMDLDAVYYVEVVLTNGTKLRVCPFSHNSLTPVEEVVVSPAMQQDRAYTVERGGTVILPTSEPSVYAWYSLAGQCVASGNIPAYSGAVTAPQEIGWYILQVRNASESMTWRIIVL